MYGGIPVLLYVTCQNRLGTYVEIKVKRNVLSICQTLFATCNSYHQVHICSNRARRLWYIPYRIIFMYVYVYMLHVFLDLKSLPVHPASINS